MTTDLLFRVSGAALMLGAALATLGWLLFVLLDPARKNMAGRQWTMLNFTIIFGGVFMAMGLPGFYASQADRAGWPGMAGFVLFFVGIAIPYVAVQAIETASAPEAPPTLRQLASIGAPSLFTGAFLTGLATLNAGIYPRWLAAALILAVLLGLLTRLVRLPPVLNRGAIPAFFTAVVGVIGFYVYWQA
jgi:hypothetical protein